MCHFWLPIFPPHEKQDLVDGEEMLKRLNLSPVFSNIIGFSELKTLDVPTI